MKWRAIKHLWFYRKGSPELPGDTAGASVLTAGLTAVVIVGVPAHGCVYVCVFRGRRGREVLLISATATGRTKKKYLHWDEEECLLS